MDDTSYSRARLRPQKMACSEQDRHRADDVACSFVAIAARVTGIDRPEKSLRLSRGPDARVSARAEMMRSQAADGLSRVPRLPRRRCLMLGSAGKGIDSREFHRSAGVLKKLLNLAQES